MKETGTLQHCPAWRRFLAVFYDSILLFSVLFIATALILPFSGGNAIGSGNVFYPVYLMACGYAYFSWQWTHGGQTLGMRAWRVRIVDLDGNAVTWPGATRRYVLSLFSWLILGAGFLWALFDRCGRTLHDRWSGTYLVVVAGDS